MKLHCPPLLSCLLLGTAFISVITRSEAQTFTTLHYFVPPGIFPNSTLVPGSDGNYYGTTNAGGAAGEGTFYKITGSGAMTVLYSFGVNPGDGGGSGRG